MATEQNKKVNKRQYSSHCLHGKRNLKKELLLLPLKNNTRKSMWWDLCNLFQFPSSINISSHSGYVGERSSWNNSLENPLCRSATCFWGLCFFHFFALIFFLSSMQKWDDWADSMSSLCALREIQIHRTSPMASSLNRTEKSLLCYCCLKNVKLESEDFLPIWA